MKKFLTLLIRHWTKSPVKVLLTLMTVALGTGILSLSFSASEILNREVTAKMAMGGTVLYVVNGKWASDGTVDRERPGQWDEKAPGIVARESGVVKASAVVSTPPFDEVTVGTQTYRLRSAVATEPGYFDIFGLKITSGLPMTAADVDQGSKKIWISESLAQVLFGSVEKAIGQYVQPPGRMFRRGPDQGQAQNLVVSYTVAGVFADPQEVARKAYGLGDLIYPYTSMITAGENTSFIRRMMAEQFVVKTDGTSKEKAEAMIRQVLSSNYGVDVKVAAWEGSPRGVSTYLEQLRQTVSIFTISINLLGLVILLISCLGIFSIMVVEALGRRREIALERAIGASQIRVIQEFWTWSLALSFLGAVIGLLLAQFISPMVLGTLGPLIGELSTVNSAGVGLQIGAMATALILTLGIGGILGLLPSISAVKGTISDTLREV